MIRIIYNRQRKVGYKMKKYISIDIGGTAIKYGVIQEDAEIVLKKSMPTEAWKGGPSILEKVVNIVRELLEVTEHQISGICISTAGMVDTIKGSIFYAAPLIPNYAGTEFKKVLEETFHIPCEVENDVNCAGLAEYKNGAAKGSKVAVMLTIGTGIGGCILLNGEVFHGFSNSACEVGYMHMEESDFQTLGAASILTKKVAKWKNEPEEEWNKLFAEYCEKFPEMKELWDKYYNGCDMSDLFNSEEYLAKPEKAEATRSSSGTILNMIKNVMPNLIGGSADLAPSNKTNMKDAGDFSKENYAGTNLHFGVREQAMAAIGNGLALHGGLRPFVATFFVFSDYTKPMARLTSLMKLPVVYVFTHDSIGVGEDGPTHEPIEQLAAFRSMPNFTVFRPCDRTETALAWEYAIESKDEPTALVLTRQNLPQMACSSKEALKGAYILEDSDKETPDGIIIASGSEVNLAVSAKAELKNAGIDVRVVSMPSMDVFEKQSEEYKESVLPKSVRKRVAVEALSDFGWYRYVGLDGKVICMKGFGASGPANQLFEHFGFTVENVVNTVKSLF